MANIATLETLVTANITPFTTAMERVKTSASSSSVSVGKAFSVIAAGMSIVSAASINLINQIDEIGDASQRLGISVSAYQQLSYAAKLGETSMEALSSGMMRLNRNVFEAVGGSANLSATFNKLGLNATNLSKMSLDQQFVKVADAIKSVKNENEQAAIAIELFGRNGSQYLNLIKSGVGDLVSEYKNLNIELSATDVLKMSELSDQLKRAYEIVKGNLYKAFVSLYEPIQFAKSGFETMAVVMNNVYDIAAKIGNEIASWKVTQAAGNLLSSTGNAIAEAAKEVAAVPGILGRSAALGLQTGEWTLNPNLVGGVRAGERQTGALDILSQKNAFANNEEKFTSFVSSIDKTKNATNTLADTMTSAANKMGFINSQLQSNTQSQIQTTLTDVLGDKLQPSFQRNEYLDDFIKLFHEQAQRGTNPEETQRMLNVLEARSKGDVVYSGIVKELAAFRQEQLAKTGKEPKKAEVVIKVSTDKGFNMEIAKSSEVQASILRNAQAIMATEAASLR